MAFEFVAKLTKIFSGASAGTHNRWSAVDYLDKTVFAQSSVRPQYWSGNGPARELPGLGDPEGWAGVTSIAGHLVLWRGDVIRYNEINDFSTWIPVAETAVSGRVNTLFPFAQPGPGEYVEIRHDGDDFAVGQFVRIDYNVGGLSEYFLFYEVTASFPTNRAYLTALDVSGQIPVGTVIPAGTAIQSVDANSAGEIHNIGSTINGDIFGIVPLAEYGVILKRRSIQSMQYVGRANGTFFIRPEITNEGPISKNAWGLIHERGIVFVGESAIYEYTGGQNLNEIAAQHSPEVFKELDRSRVDEIIVYQHRELGEVWIVYPLRNSTKQRVLVYNYDFGSVTLDDYDEKLSAVGALDWEVGPAWEDLVGTWEDQEQSWAEYIEDGSKTYTIIASDGETPDGEAGEVSDEPAPRLAVHGRVFSRVATDNCSPEAYRCVAETNDFDGGDKLAWKYWDTLYVTAEVRNTLTAPKTLYVELGARDNLDSTIRWTSPARIDVSGNGMIMTKVNLRAAGRFVRIRFSSGGAGVEWRIAGYTLIGRKGGTY